MNQGTTNGAANGRYCFDTSRDDERAAATSLWVRRALRVFLLAWLVLIVCLAGYAMAATPGAVAFPDGGQWRQQDPSPPASRIPGNFAKLPPADSVATK